MALSLGSTASATEVAERITLKSGAFVASKDKVRIGLIGSGIIGHYDTDTALKVEGVELVAVCDLYTGRLDRAKEKWGSQIYITRDYRELLAKKDVDAVLICTPDHWHQKIAIDAMNAGKHVYCEKPMIQKITDGQAIIDTQKNFKGLENYTAGNIINWSGELRKRINEKYEFVHPENATINGCSHIYGPVR